MQIVWLKTDLLIFLALHPVQFAGRTGEQPLPQLGHGTEICNIFHNQHDVILLTRRLSYVLTLLPVRAHASNFWQLIPAARTLTLKKLYQNILPKIIFD